MDNQNDTFEATRIEAIRRVHEAASFMVGLGDMTTDPEGANYFYACANYLRDWLDQVLPSSDWPVKNGKCQVIDLATWRKHG